PEDFLLPPFKQQVRLEAAHARVRDRAIEPCRVERVPHERPAVAVEAHAAALPARDDERVRRQVARDIQARTFVARLEAMEIEHAPRASFADEEACHRNNYECD